MSFHLYTINELYSNADGSIQFIEMAVDSQDDEGFWAGHSISVTPVGTTPPPVVDPFDPYNTGPVAPQGGASHSYTFPRDLPSEATANTKVLIATQGFANLGIVSPDFIIPSGFLFTNGGTVNYAGVDVLSYAALPTDGVSSLGRSGSAAPASPTNFAGASAALPLISGGAGDDTLVSRPGNDIIDGGAGVNTVTFSGNRLNYTVTPTANGYTVQDRVGAGGTDSLSYIQELQFADGRQNLVIAADAATIPTAQLNSLTEMYVAYFNRVPEASGLDFWINQFKGGMSLNDIGNSFYAAAVAFSSLTGYSSTMTNTDFVTKIYQNVLGRSSPDQAGLDYWLTGLANGSQTRGSLVNTILTAAHAYKGDPTYGPVANLLDNKLAVGKYAAVTAGADYLNSNDAITHGMAIAAAVTATDTSAAVGLIGLSSLLPFPG